ncbi:glycosyltransferase family 9 protein [Desulfovibrio legallii]|uniref:glycosyltransferase family 9 protein n=1 Tax=Desulfovibrio legallii TaxID=571438 RepID=UPI003A8D3640
MAAFLVLQAARFGDLVQSGRLLRGLQAQGETHLAVDAGLAPLARLLYPFAQVWELALHGRPTGAALARNREVLAQWRRQDYAAVYNCNYSGLTAALCRVFAPEQVHGYRPTPGGLLRSPWAALGFGLSARRAETPLNLVDFWGHFCAEPALPAAVNPRPLPGGGGIGVVLAGREARRSLSLPMLTQLLPAVFRLLGGPAVFLLGTAAEQPAARRLRRLLPTQVQERVRDLCGKTDWPGLTAALTGLDLLLTPDTGTMHLAARLGVPVLAFFLSSAWAHETGPSGPGHHVWQAALPCAPCLESAPCPRGTACGKPLASADVLRSVAAVLRGGPVPPPPPGLQVWRTGLDVLGGRRDLLAGEDAPAAARARWRALLFRRLRLPDASEQGNTPAPEWFAPDAGWMLPPGRYC